MGCWRNEADDMLQPLHPQPPTAQNTLIETLDPSTTRGDGVAVLSLMNSNFEALVCKDVLRAIFENLPLADLARAACVCRLWFSVASDREMQTKTLHPQPPTAQNTLIETLDPSTTRGDGVAVLSLMNSNFEALVCKDVLRVIFENLPLADLARAACVCRLWFSVASDREMQTRAFRLPWKLKEVVGNPSSGGFWRDNSLGRFAISHRLIRGDSVAGLAVKYSVQVVDIKRLNNMMSDHGIYSRERLLIPLSSPDLLIGGTCYIELDASANREVAVLYLEGGPDRKVNSSNRASSERGKRRIIDSLKRSMRVDDGTAQYYLSISDGNPRAALVEFSDDLRWERQTGLA